MQVIGLTMTCKARIFYLPKTEVGIRWVAVYIGDKPNELRSVA